MKKIITSLLAFTLVFGAIHAQTTENKDENREHKRGHEMAYKKLDLSEDQKEKALQFRKEFHKKMSDLKKQDGLSKDQLKESIKKLKQQQREKMESILTPDQKAKLAQIKSEWKATHKDREVRSGKGMHLKALNLTFDQKEKMKEMHSEFRTARESIKKDQTLSEVDKKAKMQDLANKHKEQVRSILTPSQLEKLETLKKEHREKESK